MQIDLVQCLVKIRQDGKHGNSEVVKAGPGAVRATEIPLLRALHDIEEGMSEETCSIHAAKVVGSVSVDKETELRRLRSKYRGNVIQAIYPGGRGLASKLSQCELPDGCLAPAEPEEDKAKKGKKEATPKAKAEKPNEEALREQLIAAGKSIPKDATAEDLQKLVDELEGKQ